MKDKIVYGAFMFLVLLVPLSGVATNTGNSVEFYKKIEQKANSAIEEKAHHAKNLEYDVAKKQAALEEANKAVEAAQAKLQEEGGYANSQALIAAQKAKQQAEFTLAETQVKFEEATFETERLRVAATRANAAATSKNGSKEQTAKAYQQASEAQKKAKEAAEKAQQAKKNLAKLQQQQKNAGAFYGLSFSDLVDHNYGNYQEMFDDTIK